MYILSQEQINAVKQQIISRGSYYEPLAHELIDQACEQIEQLIDEGYTFKQAMDKVCEDHTLNAYQLANEATSNYINYSTMFKNYVKLGVRSLMKYKAISLLNLTGLTLGVFVFMSIALYVSHETSYDKFHPNIDNLYRITSIRTSETGETSRSAFTGAPWAPELKESLPDIKSAVRLMKYRLPVSVSKADGSKTFYEKDLIWADADFFQLFGFKLLRGNPDKVLQRPDQVVITESAALKYFGKDDPVGQTLVYEGNVPLTITGIAENFPANSHLKADIIGSFSSLGHSFWFNIIENWNVRYYYSYLAFDSPITPMEVEAKVTSVLKPLIDPSLSIQAQRVDQIHVNSHLENELSANNSLLYIILAGVIGLTILSISIINYINLSNARALKRTKEVGVIKVIGSNKFLIFIQFMTEALVLSFISIVLALFLTSLTLPHLIELLNVNLILPQPVQIIGVALLLCVTIAFLSGIYISFKMAGVNIIPALKGKIVIKNNKGRITLRNGLLTFQFLSCIALLTSALLISDQIKYLLHADTGYTKENIVEIPINSDDMSLADNFKESLTKLSGIASVSYSSHRLSGDQLYTSAYVQGQDTLVMGRLHIDYDFLEVFDIQLQAGRSFSVNFSNDTTNFIINAAASKNFGYSSPEQALGNTISYAAQGDNGNYLKTGEIVGVVRNFNFQSLHNEITPIVMDIQPPRNHFINVKHMAGVSQNQLLGQIERQWSQFYPTKPLTLNYVDERYKAQYQSEDQLYKLVLAFGFVSMFISVFGLLGLTHFDTVVRSKEIGIRKLLGGSVSGIVTIFFKEYLLIIIISSIIAIPGVLWMSNNWLSSFAYRVDIDWMNVFTPVLFIIFVVFATSLFSIVKAALINPINSIRHE